MTDESDQCVFADAERALVEAHPDLARATLDTRLDQHQFVLFRPTHFVSSAIVTTRLSAG